MCPKRYPWISPTREAIDSIRKGFVHLPPGGHLELNRSRWIYARRCSRKHASLIFFNSLTRSPHRTTRPLRTPATPPLVRIFTSVFTPHLQVTTRGVNVMQRPSRSLSLSLSFSLSLSVRISLRVYVGARTALILTLILALIYPWSGYAFACIKPYTMRLYQHVRGLVSRSYTVWIQYAAIRVHYARIHVQGNSTGTEHLYIFVTFIRSTVILIWNRDSAVSKLRRSIIFKDKVCSNIILNNNYVRGEFILCPF